MVNFLFSHHHLFGAQSFLFFLCQSYSFFLCPHIFIFIYTVHAGCLYVTDTLSTPTITEPPSVECQDLLIPHRSMCALWKRVDCSELVMWGPATRQRRPPDVTCGANPTPTRGKASAISADNEFHVDGPAYPNAFFLPKEDCSYNFERVL